MAILIQESLGAIGIKAQINRIPGAQNPKLDKIIENARFAESKTLYDAFVKDMIQIAFDEVPRVPLAQPTMNVAMQKDVSGYMYWFHLQPDYRQLGKA